MKAGSNRAKKFMVLFITVAAILSISLNIVLRIWQTRLDTLKEYETSVIRQYSSNGVLNSVSERDEVLDIMEEYVKENKSKFMIKYYKRIPDAILISYWLGQHYQISPQVAGMK